MMFRLSALGLVVAVATCVSPAVAAPVPAGPTDAQLKEMALKLNDLTSLPAMNRELRELSKDVPTAKRLVKVAAALQKAGGKEAPLKYNACFVLAKLAQNQKEYGPAETFYEWCLDHALKLQSADKIVQTYYALLDTLWDQKKFAAAEELTQKLLDADDGDKIDDYKPGLLEKLVQAKAKQGDTDAALILIDKLLTLYPGWRFLSTKAWVYREAGQFDKAADTYLEAVADLKKSKLPADKKEREQIARNIRYILSSVYVDAKQVDKAADVLKALIKDDPDNAGYHNDLGFIWCDAGKNYPEAEKLIRKAIELDAKARKKLLETAQDEAGDDGDVNPLIEKVAKGENAAYLDSLGWVLFKQEKYAEALPYLEKAAADPDEGNHIEIYDHVADCQAALGKKAEALATYQKALKLDDVSPRDAERRKKVTEKLKKLSVAEKK